MLSPSAATFHWPRISIITPSFNQEHFLEKCIQSVLGQNYPNLEYIIIDGGSTDGSQDLIRQHQSRLAYWVSEPDQGQSDAINKGLRQASGELVAWLNSDDFYLPNALALAAQTYLSQPTGSFYFGNGYRVNKDGQIKRSHFRQWPYRFHRDALIFGLNYIMQPATFINHHYLAQTGYLATHLHYGLDTDLWLRLSALAEPQSVPAFLAASREYGTTKTASGSFARVEELRKLAAQYAGQPITPGVVCYYLDTLFQYARQNSVYFPKGYRRSILRFWADTSLLMERFEAGPDGVPLPANQVNSWWYHFRRAGWVKLKTLFKNMLLV